MILADDVPALAVAVDKFTDGTTEVFTTECEIATIDGDANPIVDDELDPINCTDAPVGICWNNSVAG